MDFPSNNVLEVANCLNVGGKIVRKLLQKGEGTGFKVAGTWRFKRDDIDSWIEQRKMAATQKEWD